MGKRNFLPGSKDASNMAGREHGLISQRHGWWTEGQGHHTQKAVTREEMVEGTADTAAATGTFLFGSFKKGQHLHWRGTLGGQCPSGPQGAHVFGQRDLS